MTIQVSELLFYEGEKYSLLNVPPIPDSILQLKPLDLYEKSTALHRGYVCTWEINDDKLYLVDISSSNYEFINKPPFFADWFNKELIFGIGNRKLSSWGASLYEHETNVHLTIENGLVVKINKVKNDSYNAGPLTL